MQAVRVEAVAMLPQGVVCWVCKPLWFLQEQLTYIYLPWCLQAAPGGSGCSFASTCERLAAPLRQAVDTQRSAWQPQWPSARPTLQRWASFPGLYLSATLLHSEASPAGSMLHRIA